MDKDEFLRRVNEIVKKADGDSEQSHGDFDDLMEEVLIEHGYAEGVEVIRSTTRWYA